METMRLTMRKDHRRAVTEAGDLIIARRDAGVVVPLGDGEWLVTATTHDTIGHAQGIVAFDEAGFRGRQWTSAIDGQQYGTLAAVMRAALDSARFDAKVKQALWSAAVKTCTSCGQPLDSTHDDTD